MQKGLTALLAEHPGLRFHPLEEGQDAGSGAPDILIIDLYCQPAAIASEIQQCKNRYSDVNLLVILHTKTAEVIRTLMNAGIRNILLKECEEHEICDAIQACAQRQRYFCNEILTILFEAEEEKRSQKADSGLTEREIQIMQLLTAGKRIREIAEILHISPLTVSTHKKNIYRKLKISHNTELVTYAYRHGLRK